MKLAPTPSSIQRPSNRWQPIAWPMPPIFKSRNSFLEFKALPTAGASSHIFIRTPQHTGHPHPVLVLVNLGNSSLITKASLPTKLEARLFSGSDALIFTAFDSPSINSGQGLDKELNLTRQPEQRCCQGNWNVATEKGKNGVKLLH